MARFKIIRLNKMTCGTRRGLVDMVVEVQDIKPDAFLLPGTNLCSQPNDDFPEPYYAGGIATETNTDYEYVKTDAICDYKTNNNKHQLAQEINSSYLIANEDQLSIDPATISGGLSSSSAIQLTPEFWLLSAYKAEEAFQYNSDVSSFRVVYEFELDSKANEKACLSSEDIRYLPLNDLLDLCVKSMFKKSISNNAIPGNLLLEDQRMKSNRNVDQWFVFEKNPIDFCQHMNDAFAISQPMTKQPYRLQSNIYNQVQSNAIEDAHEFQLVQDQIETALYKKPSKYYKKDGNAAASYADYIASIGGFLGIDELTNFFTPDYLIRGIGYNYIVDIEQNRDTNKQYDNPTIYDNGDIYGSFMLGKNMYNALYSMSMKQENQIISCRTYVGVQSLGNNVALKYYDDTGYEFDPRNNHPFANMLSSSSAQTKIYPYQKIETYMPIQSGHDTKHKSTLFSLKISNTGLDDESIEAYDDSTKHLAENLKKDISNAMKHLADSIAPANTQLFATYFI